MKIIKESESFALIEEFRTKRPHYLLAFKESGEFRPYIRSEDLETLEALYEVLTGSQDYELSASRMSDNRAILRIHHK